MIEDSENPPMSEYVSFDAYKQRSMPDLSKLPRDEAEKVLRQCRKEQAFQALKLPTTHSLLRVQQDAIDHHLEYVAWEEDDMTYSEKQETPAQPTFQVDDILDTLIAQASVPNLAALFKKAKGQGLIKPAYVYHQDS